MTYGYRHLIVEAVANDRTGEFDNAESMLDGIQARITDVDGVIAVRKSDMSNAFDSLKGATQEEVQGFANDVAEGFADGDYGENPDAHDVAHESADNAGLVFVNWKASAVATIATADDFEQFGELEGADSDSPGNVLAYCVVSRYVLEAIERLD